MFLQSGNLESESINKQKNFSKTIIKDVKLNLKDEENLKQRIEKGYNNLEEAMKNININKKNKISFDKTSNYYDNNIQKNYSFDFKKNNEINSYNKTDSLNFRSNSGQKLIKNRTEDEKILVKNYFNTYDEKKILKEHNNSCFEHNSNLNLEEKQKNIHVYIPEKAQNTDLMAIISNLNSNYEKLVSKIKKIKKTKNTQIVENVNEADISLLQRDMLEMGRLIEQLDDKKYQDKERQLILILEKERKKNNQEKEKLSKSFLEQIDKLKLELEKSNSIRKEYELKFKLFEPEKLKLEKKLKQLENEKKTLEYEIIKITKNEAYLESELNRLKSINMSLDKELKQVIEKKTIIEKEKLDLAEELKKILPKISKLETENQFYKKDIERLEIEKEEKIRELKQEISFLTNKIKLLQTELDNLKEENLEMGFEIKEEKNLKERIMIDKMNIEFRLKETELEIFELRKKIQELLNKPPQIIRETLPAKEIIVEKPIEKIEFIDNPQLISKLTALEEGNNLYRNDIIMAKGKIDNLEMKLIEKIEENNSLIKKFKDLEMNKNNEMNNIIFDLRKENDEIKSKLIFCEKEMKRQFDINQEKNIYVSNYINSLTEKNNALENMLKFRK